MGRYRFRSPHSEETKQKIRLARIGQGIGAENPNWKGGQFINDGYRYIYSPSHPRSTKDGYVLEHRAVIEKHIGRYLEKDETVHHRNGDTLDNGLENLELCQSNGRHFIDHHLLERDEKGRFAKTA